MFHRNSFCFSLFSLRGVCLSLIVLFWDTRLAGPDRLTSFGKATAVSELRRQTVCVRRSSREEEEEGGGDEEEEEEEEASVCWAWMPSATITPQGRKHMKRIFGHSLSLCHDLPQKTVRGQQQQAGVTATRASTIVLVVAIKAQRKPDKTKTGRGRGASRSCSPMLIVNGLATAQMGKLVVAGQSLYMDPLDLTITFYVGQKSRFNTKTNTRISWKRIKVNKVQIKIFATFIIHD